MAKLQADSSPIIPGGSDMARSADGQMPECKVLLLGAGESGKVRCHVSLSYHKLTLPILQSTVLKQMKMWYHGAYNDEERESYKEVIFNNINNSMKCVCS